jgi:hypothetical protein
MSGLVIEGWRVRGAFFFSYASVVLV